MEGDPLSTYLTWLTYSRGITMEPENVNKDYFSYRLSTDALARATAAAVSLIESGGIETIMAAMKSFPDDEDIQGKGCNAIGNAFYYNNKTNDSYYSSHLWHSLDNDRTIPTIEDAMPRFVHKLNGIELVVSVMKKFQNNASVQNMGCHVLWQLSRKQVLRDALKKGGALGAVGEATEKHDGNSLKTKATAFFEYMFRDN